MASTSLGQRKRWRAPTRKPACLPRNAPAKIATADTGFTYASGAKAILPAAPNALKTAVGTRLATEGCRVSKLNINNATEMIAKIIEDTAVKSGK